MYETTVPEYYVEKALFDTCNEGKRKLSIIIYSDIYIYICVCV